jgi:hypothetical protein
MSSPTYSAAHHEPLGLVEKKPSTRIAGTLWAADKAGAITAVMPGLVVKKCSRRKETESKPERWLSYLRQ